MRRKHPKKLQFHLIKLTLVLYALFQIRKSQFITSNGIEPNILTYRNTIKESFTFATLWSQRIKLGTKSLNNKSFASLLLLLAADIETNPGPSPCQECSKTVRVNQKRLRCT